jgi:hypothetical protein
LVIERWRASGDEAEAGCGGGRNDSILGLGGDAGRRTADVAGARRTGAGGPVCGVIAVGGFDDAMQRCPESVRGGRPRDVVAVTNFVGEDVGNDTGDGVAGPDEFNAVAGVVEFARPWAVDRDAVGHAIVEAMVVPSGNEKSTASRSFHTEAVLVGLCN